MPTSAIVPSVFDADLPTVDYDVLTATPAQVYESFRAAHRLSPIAMGPHGPEVLSYDLVQAVLRDNRFQAPAGYTLAVQGITSGALWDKVVNSIMGMHGAEHLRVRGVVSKAFTPRAVQRLHATIIGVVNDIIEPISRRGYCEVVTEIARPYPVPIICALLGAARKDWQQISVWADDIFQAFNLSFTVDDVPNVMRAWGELDVYVDDMVAQRRLSLTDDLLSDLIRAEHDGERLNGEELRSLAAAMLLAGADTTRNQVAAAIGALCDHPDQWQLLRDDPDLAVSAANECMRYSPSGNFLVRIATQDVELGGVLVPKDTIVFANISTANRDPAVYEDPDRFDITRQGVPQVLNFGAGAHYCLGVNLARLEIAELLKAVTGRFANPRITGPVPWKPVAGLSGPQSLPIAFDNWPR